LNKRAGYKDELLSDVYPINEVDDVVYEVQAQVTARARKRPPSRSHLR